MRRLRLPALALVMACLLAAAAAAACDSDDDGGATPTPPTAAIPTPTQGPPGFVDGDVFTSVQRRYRVTFPQGWEPDEDFIVTPLFVTDVFRAPNDGTPVEPSIQVTCNFPGDATAEDFIANKRQFAQTFAQNELVDDRPATLAGAPAVQLTYNQMAGQTLVRKIEIHQFRGTCGWSLTVTSDPSKNYDQQFLALVASMEFIN